MFILNSNHHGDTIIKRLNFDLFYKGYPIFVARIIQIQNVISQLIFEILKILFFNFQLTLNGSFKIE